MSIHNTRTVRVKDLDGSEGYALVGDQGGITNITGEVYDSSVIPGCKAIEVEHGTLYVDNDEEIGVLDSWPLPVQVTEQDLIEQARDLMSGGWDDPNFPDAHNAEYLRGMVELISSVARPADEDCDAARARLMKAIRPA